MQRLVLMLALCVSVMNAQEIRTEDVGRILNALAADSMEGRGSLTRGNAMAQEYIIREYAGIGLVPLPGAADFRQRFPITSVTPGARAVSLNGVPVAAGNVFAISEADSFRADETSGLEVVYVGRSADNPRARISDLTHGTKNALLVIDPAHKRLFDRYAGFLSRRSFQRTLSGRPTVVAVLADSVPIVHFTVRLTNVIATAELANIVGVIPGRTRDMVVFSGHYDHLGIVTPVNGDSIANGADDDASGTTAVLTLARYYKARGTPERTLVFAAFAAEEIGEYGSEHFAEVVPADSVAAMCNIEMIGQVSKWGEGHAWVTGYDITSFGKIITEAGQAAGFTFRADPYPDQNLFYRSDNASLARKGVPAHTVSTTPIDTDTYYHSVDDEIGTLDIAHVAAAIRGIAAGMEPIVTGKRTPTRVPPGALK